MKIRVTKEWCEQSAEIEGDSEIGAGCPLTHGSVFRLPYCDPDNLEGSGPTDEERRENAKTIDAMHTGNRFRLMFGMPMLPQPELRRQCLQCRHEYDSTLCQCPECKSRMFCDANNQANPPD